MPRLDYTTDDQSDERLNPASELNARESAATTEGQEPTSQEGSAQDQLKDSESSPDSSFDYEPGQPSTKGGKSGDQKAQGFFRRRGGLIGILSIFGISGGILASFFGPASMLINLTENMTLSNDSSSTAMQRRFTKVFGNATGNPDIVCTNRAIKCKMGKISNGGIRKLSKNGVRAVGADGKLIPIKRTGYPSSKPTTFRIEIGNGKFRNVGSKDLSGFLSQKENRKLASKVLGRWGAFKNRMVWSGKHITKRFYGKFNLSKTGGLASAASKKIPFKERYANFVDKLPGMDKMNELKGSLEKKMESKLNKSKKAGTAYLIAVASCVGIKIPGFVANAIAMIQLMQLLPVIQDIVLSPGSSAKSSGITNSFTSEDAELVGNLLTERTKNSEGKMTSALDSQYLLYSMGASKSKPKVSEKYAPGYQAFTNGAVRVFGDLNESLAPVCNFVLNPLTMYSMMALDAATKLNPATLVLGVVGSMTLPAIINGVVGIAIEHFGPDIIKSIVENSDAKKAKGEDLGDALGVGAAAFFSSGAMARHMPVLKESQVSAFNDMRIANEQLQKEMDIASLSPFDTSSRYTFLGSIMFGLRDTMLKSGSYNNSFASIFSNIMRLPAMTMSFTPGVNAATNYSSSYCGYAKDFGLDTEDGDSPALNMAGMPCSGITMGQDRMSTETAIDILYDEGWLVDKDNEEPKEGSTIEDLVADGFIKDGSPLHSFIEECGNPETGDHLTNSVGCTVNTAYTSGDFDSLDSNGSIAAAVESNNEEYEASKIEGAKNPRALEAMSVFLLDFQIMQSFNGEDEIESEDSSINQSGTDQESSELTGKIVLPIKSSDVSQVTFTAGYGRYPGGGIHRGVDLANSSGATFVSACDGVVDLVKIHPQFGNVNRYGDVTSSNYVWVKCDSGVFMGYGHFYEKDLPSSIKKGKRLSAGDSIAKIGNQGNSTGAHLHFQINTSKSDFVNASETLNPVNYLRSKGASWPSSWPTPGGHLSSDGMQGS